MGHKANGAEGGKLGSSPLARYRPPPTYRSELERAITNKEQNARIKFIREFPGDAGAPGWSPGPESRLELCV